MESASNPSDPESNLKEIKIHIPLRHHLGLRGYKLLTGTPIRDVVEEAVGLYLRRFGSAATDGLPSWAFQAAPTE